VNPYRDEDFARAIHRCLQQSPLEKQHWHAEQSAWCRHNTVQLWAETIVMDMNKVHVCLCVYRRMRVLVWKMDVNMVYIYLCVYSKMRVLA
jgi:trehalose-6-phosphate synthase